MARAKYFDDWTMHQYIYNDGMYIKYYQNELRKLGYTEKEILCADVYNDGDVRIAGSVKKRLIPTFRQYLEKRGVKFLP
jgi:hypothetical protein